LTIRVLTIRVHTIMVSTITYSQLVFDREFSDPVNCKLTVNTYKKMLDLIIIRLVIQKYIKCFKGIFLLYYYLCQF